MPILSKKLMAETCRIYQEEFGLQARFMDLSCRATYPAADPLGALGAVRQRRNAALQESIDHGEPLLFTMAPRLAAWVIGLEDNRRILGGLCGGEVLQEPDGPTEPTVESLLARGLEAAQAHNFVASLPVWPEARMREAGAFLQRTFYKLSGWKPELMNENRLRMLQREQIQQSIDDQRKRGRQVLYAFEKERMLLSNIRTGDRNGARRILNDMLATIYLSSPQLPVLRARTVELMSCLTRAAIEDNPLLEPLIEHNHTWTERLIKARDFEGLSVVLMETLDSFIDGIYLHGMNRSNAKVHLALDFISQNYMRRVSLREVAAASGLSPTRLAHLVKEHTGRTVLQTLQQTRIRQAQQLLERSQKSCTEIGYEVGFEDQSYFIKQFKRLTGTTPARHRKRYFSC